MQTDSPGVLPCPSCGDAITVLPTDDPFPCPTCGEELHKPPNENRLFLVHPLSTYSGEAGDGEPEQWLEIEHVIRSIDYRKRLATVDISARRLAERMQLGTQMLKIGGGLLVLSTVLLTVALARILVARDIQIEAVIFLLIAVMFAPMGLFFCGWSLIERWSWKKYAATIQEERHVLEEEGRFHNDSGHTTQGDSSVTLIP